MICEYFDNKIYIVKIFFDCYYDIIVLMEK